MSLPGRRGRRNRRRVDPNSSGPRQDPPQAESAAPPPTGPARPPVQAPTERPSPTSQSPAATPAPATAGGPAPAAVGEATADSVTADLATIDADDVQLVLQRAVQLSDESLVVAEQFPVNSLEQVAAELHLPITALADALAEYRAGAIERPTVTSAGETKPPKRSVLDRLIGPRRVAVTNRTQLSEGDAVDQLSKSLRRQHRLRIRVNPQGAVIAVRRRGLVPVVSRSVRTATGRAGLAGVKEVRAAAVEADQGSTSLCVVADVSDQRIQSVVAGSAIAAGGTFVVGTVALVTAPVTLVAVPVALGAGWVTARLSHRYRVKHVIEEVEITADQVATGSPPPSRTVEVVEAVGRLASRRRRPAD